LRWPEVPPPVLDEPAQCTSGAAPTADGCGLGAGDAVGKGDDVGAGDGVSDGPAVDWPGLDEAWSGPPPQAATTMSAVPPRAASRENRAMSPRSARDVSGILLGCRDARCECPR